MLRYLQGRQKTFSSFFLKILVVEISRLAEISGKNPQMGFSKNAKIGHLGSKISFWPKYVYYAPHTLNSGRFGQQSHSLTCRTLISAISADLSNFGFSRFFDNFGTYFKLFSQCQKFKNLKIAQYAPHVLNFERKYLNTFTFNVISSNYVRMSNIGDFEKKSISGFSVIFLKQLKIRTKIVKKT